jgi:hypothetical protein
MAWAVAEADSGKTIYTYCRRYSDHRCAHGEICYLPLMPATKQTKRKATADLLDQATSQLLRAVKAKADKKGKPLRRSELLKQGYSERFVEKVEQA